MASTSKNIWVGFDLGGTKMLGVVFDENFKDLGRKRRKTKGYEGAETGVDRLVQTIRRALEDAEVDVDQLAGIGVGCPGPVDMDRGVILEAANLGWRDVELKKRLEMEFSCRAEILNDVDAGVFAENRFGAAIGARTVFGVFPGTGIGGGCVYEGQILRGTKSSCMEIGHVTVNPRGRWCGCGRRGCLETKASRLAISAEVAKAAFRGEAPHLRKIVGTDLVDIRSGALAEAIKNGDEIVERIVRDAGHLIGYATAGVVSLLLPDVILLGGGLVEAMPELFLEEVELGIKEHVMSAFADTFRVVPSKLGDDASAMGAAGWIERVVRGS